jgi:hypothetical protein
VGVDELMLDGLERTDGLAELHALAGVRDGALDELRSQPDELRRRRGPDHRPGAAQVAIEHERVVERVRVEVEPPDRAAGIHRFEHLDPEARRLRDDDDRPLVLDAQRRKRD